MCREHPEVCPHDYRWSGSITDKANNVEIERYNCCLCGMELKKEKKLNG
jgi:hypothetical protein